MTGLSASTLEIICLLFTLAISVVGFMHKRTRQKLWYYLLIGLALVSVEYRKELTRVRERERLAKL